MTSCHWPLSSPEVPPGEQEMGLIGCFEFQLGTNGYDLVYLVFHK